MITSLPASLLSPSLPSSPSLLCCFLSLSVSVSRSMSSPPSVFLSPFPSLSALCLSINSSHSRASEQACACALLFSLTLFLSPPFLLTDSPALSLSLVVLPDLQGCILKHSSPSFILLTPPPPPPPLSLSLFSLSSSPPPLALFRPFPLAILPAFPLPFLPPFPPLFLLLCFLLSPFLSPLSRPLLARSPLFSLDVV